MMIYSKTLTLLLSVTVLLATVSSNAFAGNKERNSDRSMKRPTFTTLDTNSDGSIELAEFSTQEIPQGDHSVIFTHIDSDENGMISKEEYNNHKPPKKRKSGGRHHD